MLANMFSFKILKRSKKSLARLGVISTPHGDIETPAFIPVATRANIRTLDSDEVAEAGSQALICNTYHLHIAPGEKVVKKGGQLHQFMHWDRPLMTDSGGFQVFSLGFGKDHGVGKILKEEPHHSIQHGAQPVKVRITEDGVHFLSPIDGTARYLGPKESVRIQEDLGADIMFAFDECPSPLAGKDYMRGSLVRTHKWAKICIDSRRSTSQALFGIVQGGGFKELREESARLIGALPFEGFGIGGEFGYDKASLKKMLMATCSLLPEERPRHVLGVGHPEDFSYLAQGGGDTFDCIAPTHYARRGILFTSAGRYDITKQRFLKDQKPIDPKCTCAVCKTYTRSYVSSLLRVKELTGMKLASYHNLYFFNEQAKLLRTRIGDGDI